jgi:glycosyltransferase involved in cell wall biosynthesis
MDLGLCLVVRDEAHCITRCLDPIIHLLAQVVVVDTGSTDDTREILRARYGIEPIRRAIDDERRPNLAVHRNAGLAQLTTSWHMTLDADELVDAAALQQFIADGQLDSSAGWFCAWWNTMPDGEVFEDYKLAFFRAGYLYRGMKHTNVQTDLRARGAVASWTDAVAIQHIPEPTRLPAKRLTYREQILDALQHEPHWLRHYWFLGYMDFRAGNLTEAERSLSRVVTSASPFFPVEVLNSHMVLCEILAASGRTDEAGSILGSMQQRFEATRDDFEVRVNFRLEAWIGSARLLLDTGRAAQIRAYRFAC